jgi:hypothetical protein
VLVFCKLRRFLTARCDDWNWRRLRMKTAGPRQTAMIVRYGATRFRQERVLLAAWPLWSRLRCCRRAMSIGFVTSTIYVEDRIKSGV